MAEDEEAKQEKKAPSRKVYLHRVEIPEEMKNDAVLFADNAMDAHDIEKDVATALKKHFDAEYGGTWHCIVGASYGSSVTHETKYLLFFQLDQAHILLFCSDKPTTTSATPPPAAAA